MNYKIDQEPYNVINKKESDHRLTFPELDMISGLHCDYETHTKQNYTDGDLVALYYY